MKPSYQVLEQTLYWNIGFIHIWRVDAPTKKQYKLVVSNGLFHLNASQIKVLKSFL